MSLLQIPNRNQYDKFLLDQSNSLPFPEPPARSVVGRTDQEFLIGREEEIKKLNGVFDQINYSGEPKLVIIQGRQGVGKSSLISWFIRSKNKQSPKSLLLIPIETDAYGEIFDFKIFYQTVIRSLWNRRELEWIGHSSLVETLKALEKELSFEEFKEILESLEVSIERYQELKNNPSLLTKITQKDLRFLEKFWVIFQNYFHSIKSSLPTMEFELLICLWYSTLNNRETFKAKRALEGTDEFEGFKIISNQDAKHFFTELLKLVRWINPNTVLLIVIDHLEAGVSNPEKVYNSLFSLLLQLRQLNYLFIILSGTVDAFHSIETTVKDDMNAQIQNWSLNNVIYLNPLKQTYATQIVTVHLTNYWQKNNLVPPVNYPLYPFGKEAIEYLYELTDRDLRKMLETLYYKTHEYRVKNKVKPIITLFDGFKEFRKADTINLLRKEQIILSEKLLDPSIQDSVRSKRVEKNLVKLLEILSKAIPEISNIKHEPRINNIRPDVLIEIGETLGDLRKIAIEVKIYRKGKQIPENEVKKTHSLLKKGNVDYIVWFTNRPLHEEKYNLPDLLKKRVGRITEMTIKELGYVGLISFLDEIFTEKQLTSEEAKELLANAGLDIDKIIKEVMSLPLISKEIKSMPSTEEIEKTGIKQFLQETTEETTETEKSKEPSTEQLNPEKAEDIEVKIIAKTILENSGKTYVQAKTILKQLKKKNLDLETKYNADDAINYILKTANKLGYKTTPTRIYF